MRSLFATKLYEAKLDEPELLGELAYSIRSLAKTTPPASPGRKSIVTQVTPAMRRSTTCRSAIRHSPTREVLTRHAKTFARDCAWGKPKLDSLWANLLQAGPATTAPTSIRTVSCPARSI